MNADSQVRNLLLDLAYQTDEEILRLANEIDTGTSVPGIRWSTTKSSPVLASRRDFVAWLVARNTGSATEPVQLSGGWSDIGKGWQMRMARDGTQEFRREILEQRPPTKRYARIWAHQSGEIYGRSEHGYMRRFPSVEDAQERLGN